MNPKEVSDAELVFGGRVKELLPDWDDIPEEYKKGEPWTVKFQKDWFYFGLESYDLPWKDGIDGEKAFKHLAAIQRSWEPKHEHKVAGVAYLLDLWTDGEGTWTTKVKQPR